jgi:hypothetical protein
MYCTPSSYLQWIVTSQSAWRASSATQERPVQDHGDLARTVPCGALSQACHQRILEFAPLACELEEEEAKYDLMISMISLQLSAVLTQLLLLTSSAPTHLLQLAFQVLAPAP